MEFLVRGITCFYFKVRQKNERKRNIEKKESQLQNSNYSFLLMNSNYSFLLQIDPKNNIIFIKKNDYSVLYSDIKKNKF